MGERFLDVGESALVHIPAGRGFVLLHHHLLVVVRQLRAGKSLTPGEVSARKAAINVVNSNEAHSHVSRVAASADIRFCEVVPVVIFF